MSRSTKKGPFVDDRLVKKLGSGLGNKANPIKTWSRNSQIPIIAVQKFIKMSPKKIRLVADKIRGMKPQKAVEILPFVGKRASEPLVKVIKTAIANAKVKNVSQENLEFKEIQINEGPRLKRGRPVSRGRWHPYKRRMSHIRVVLTTLKSQSPITKSQASSKSEKSKDKKEVRKK